MGQKLAAIDKVWAWLCDKLIQADARHFRSLRRLAERPVWQHVVIVTFWFVPFYVVGFVVVRAVVYGCWQLGPEDRGQFWRLFPSIAVMMIGASLQNRPKWRSYQGADGRRSHLVARRRTM